MKYNIVSTFYGWQLYQSHVHTCMKNVRQQQSPFLAWGLALSTDCLHLIDRIALYASITNQLTWKTVNLTAYMADSQRQLSSIFYKTLSSRFAVIYSTYCMFVIKSGPVLSSRTLKVVPVCEITFLQTTLFFIIMYYLCSQTNSQQEICSTFFVKKKIINYKNVYLDTEVICLLKIPRTSLTQNLQ